MKNTAQQTRNLAVIVAGGKGLRMQSDVKKQYILLNGMPVLARTIKAFDTHPSVDGIILVVPASDLDYCRETIIPAAAPSTLFHLVAGGTSRQDSVSNGLAMAADLSAQDQKIPIVLVHDGVRPFVAPELVDTCLDKALDTGACIPVLDITDTVKEVDASGKIVKTLNRDRLFRAQTPQIFRLDLLLTAYAHAGKTNFTGTDEASILEHAGIPVNSVPGDTANIKLTTPVDLVTAEFLLKKSTAFQTV